ncbi:MAG: hypothetical protein ACK5LV_07080 [Lachnospirales bacterium]
MKKRKGYSVSSIITGFVVFIVMFVLVAFFGQWILNRYNKKEDLKILTTIADSASLGVQEFLNNTDFSKYTYLHDLGDPTCTTPMSIVELSSFTEPDFYKKIKDDDFYKAEKNLYLQLNENIIHKLPQNHKYEDVSIRGTVEEILKGIYGHDHAANAGAYVEFLEGNENNSYNVSVYIEYKSMEDTFEYVVTVLDNDTNFIIYDENGFIENGNLVELCDDSDFDINSIMLDKY